MSSDSPVQKNVSRPRVLSGMRPTGKLHLGNYMGALANWVKLQDDYECYFFVADWHALTTDYADTSAVAENIEEVALDWLGSWARSRAQCAVFAEQGVDAFRAVFALQHDYAASVGLSAYRRTRSSRKISRQRI